MSKFKRLSAFVECSSGVVPKPETINKFVDIISAFGYNRLYLGLADAYKIKEEPFFNYKRGGYTTEDLRLMDAHAKERGVELIAQIHVLSHLHFLKKYPEYFDMFDTDSALMVGDDRVYRLIDHMLGAISDGISSRTIHLGLDEAFGLGRGDYLKNHEPKDEIGLILEHLDRIKPLIEKYGYTVEMWGDMLVGKSVADAAEIKKRLPESSTVFLWNYEENDEEKLASSIVEMKSRATNVAFAGAVWRYIGFGPNTRYSLDRLIPQADACMRAGLNHFMVTLWADKGAPCPLWATLPALFCVSEYNLGLYDGKDEKSLDKAKFKSITDMDYDDLFSLEYIDYPLKTYGGFKSNVSFWMFYTDLLLGNFDLYLSGKEGEAYARLADEYSAKKSGVDGKAFSMYEAAARVLVAKCDLPRRIRAAYSEKDKAAVEEIISELGVLRKRVTEYISVFDDYFMSDNRAFGLEVHHLYDGDLLLRIDYVVKRLRAFIDEDERIEELDGGVLKIGYKPQPTSECSCMPDYRLLISYCIQ